MKSQIKTGAILGYINIITSIVVTMIYTPIMLKLMGQSEYGLYSLVTSIVAYLSVLDMGFGNAMIRFVSKSQSEKNKHKEKKINGMFLFLYTIIGVIALIIGIVLILNITKIFGSTLTATELNKSKILTIILVITVALSFPLSIFDSYAIANEKFTFLKILAIIKTLAIPLTMIPLLILGYKSIAMVITTSIYTILFHICTMIVCFKNLNMEIDFKIKEYDKKIFKEILFYSFFIFLNLIVDSIFTNTDQVILGSFCGTVSVSIYAIAAKISQLNTTISTTISGLFLPKITKMLSEKNADKKMSDTFLKISKIQLYLMALILYGFILFGKEFIILWTGKEYIDAYIIVLLLIGPAIIPLTQNIGISIIQAKNIHQFRSVIYVIIAILNIIISIPLATKYQGIGAAIGSAIANLLGQIISMNIFYYKKAKIDIISYWKNFIKFMIPMAIISIICFKLKNIIIINNWIKLIVCCLLFTIIYILYVLANMNQEEKAYIKKYLTNNQ